MKLHGLLPDLRLRVPLGRRVLFRDRRRGVLTITGVAVALLLVLVLDALRVGALERVTAYIRTSPADVIVSQQGVRTMHMSASSLPRDTVDTAAAVPGVAWAAPVSFTSTAVDGPGGRLLTYLIGYDTRTGRGGPARIETGRAPGRGEALVDTAAADALDLAVGSPATVQGTPLTVVGLVSGGTSITNTTVFVSAEQFADLLAPTVSYVLVAGDGATPLPDLAAALAEALPGTTVQTRAQFVASESAVVGDMSADLLTLMDLVAYLIALAIIALGLMTSTLDRLRDYGVLKALGAPTHRLAGAVASQVLWITGLAVAVATVLAVLLSTLVPLLAPTVALSVSAGSVASAALGALAAGLAGALLPVWRLARVDAATAFRSSR
ncbi:MAG: ABC transporter permease [Veillonellaceae bacterium]|nr:ABC transporter permease [Veillonellaceae bacterium]